MSKPSKLSKREYALLIILATLAVAYLAFTYLLDPELDEYQTLKENINFLEENKATLEIEYNKLDDYKEEVQMYNGLAKIKTFSIRPALPQDQMLLDIERMIKDSGISFTSLNFSEISESTLSDFLTDERLVAMAPDAISKYDGHVAIRSMQLTFTSNYENLHYFFEQVNANTLKFYVDNLSIVRAEDEFVVNANVSIVAYRDLESEALRITPVPEDTGTKTIMFEPFESSGNKDTKASSLADVKQEILLFVGSYQENGPKVKISRYGEVGTDVFSDNNQMTDVYIKLDPSGDGFKYTYSIGNASYSGTVETLRNADDLFHIVVSSRKRIDINDKVGVRVHVTNNTDNTLQLSVRDDDPTNPRFILGNITGKVLVK